MRTSLKESEMAENLEVILLRTRRVLDPKDEVTSTNPTNALKNDNNVKMQPTQIYEEILKTIQVINLTLVEEKRKSKNLRRENRRLQASCYDLQTNVQPICGQATDNLKLEDSCKKLSQDLQETNVLIETLIQERKMMENTVESCRKNKENYIKKLQKKTLEKNALDREVSELKSENETLRDFYNLTRRKSQREMDDVQHQLVLLKVELEGKNVELNHLEKQLNEIHIERNKIKQELTDAKSKYQQAKFESNEDKKKKDDNQNLNQVINKLRDELERKNVECDHHQEDLTHFHQLYSAILKKNLHRDVELIDASNTLKHTQLTVENKCTWLYEELQNLRKTRDYLLKETGKDKQKLEGWEESYNNLEKTYNQLYEEYCVAQGKLKDIQKQSKDKEDDLKLTRLRLEQQQQEIIVLRARQKDLLKTIDKLENANRKPKQDHSYKSTYDEKVGLKNEKYDNEIEVNKAINDLNKKCQSLEQEILILKDINGRYLSEIQDIKQEKSLLQQEILSLKYAQKKYSIETEESKQKTINLERELQLIEDRFKRTQFSYDELKKSYAQLKILEDTEQNSRSSNLELENGKHFFDQISSIYSSLKSLKTESTSKDLQKRNHYSIAVPDLKTAILKQLNKLNDQEITKQNEEFLKMIQRKQKVLRHLQDDDVLINGEEIKTHFEETLSKVLREVQSKLTKTLVKNDSDSRSLEIEVKQKEIIALLTKQYNQIRNIEKEYNRLTNIDKNNMEPEDPYVTEALRKISEIHHKIEELQSKVEGFRGTKKDRVYLDLEHKLMDFIMKIDVIQAMGHKIIRQKKTEVIDYASDCMNKLDGNVVDKSR